MRTTGHPSPSTLVVLLVGALLLIAASLTGGRIVLRLGAALVVVGGLIDLIELWLHRKDGD